MLRFAFLSAATVFALTACGDNAQQAAPDAGKILVKPVTVAGLVQGKNPEVQAVIILERMAGIMAANKTNCPKMGAALHNFVTTNRGILNQIKAAQNAQTKAVRDSQRRAIRKRLAKVMKGIVADGLKCKANPLVQQAMKSI